MVAAYVSELERLVSKPRLDRYRPSNGDDLDTVVAYLLNVAYSESLLQGISAVEIALRNSIHQAFTIHAGTDQWFWAILKKNDLNVVNSKWTKLAEKLGQPPSSGKVIADLTFGFWPYLFDGRYTEFWRDNKEAMLRAVFPYRPVGGPPRQQITTKEIYGRLGLFRDLRNRVMHHEPIMLGVSRPDLGKPPPIVSITDIHSHMLEMLEWIDPQCALTLSFVDRFPDVSLNEESRIRARLKTHFGIP